MQTLAETNDRILATAVTARWRYTGNGIDWGKSHREIREILLETFATKHSLSLQQTLYAMGEAVRTGRTAKPVPLALISRAAASPIVRMRSATVSPR